MADLHDVMAYIIKQYPDSMGHELSNARLTKMVYLSDWHMALNAGRQISEIRWYFDNFGPFVRDVEVTAAARNDLFSVDVGFNPFGNRKKTFSLKNPGYEAKLTSQEKASIDHIIGVTKKLFWDDFIKLVYSTHPIASSERYTYLDLVAKAEEYQARKG